MVYSFVYLLLLHAGAFAEDHDRVRSRVSEGNPTAIEFYPWLVQVDFFFVNTGEWEQECAANIITEVFVLSAAHCFTGSDYKTYHRRIRAGATERNTGGVVVYVRHQFIHPNFGKQDFDGDLAVVLLAYPLLFCATIQPATIVNQGDVILDDSVVRVAGWGSSSKFSLPSEILLDIKVYTINNEVCMTRSKAFPDPLVVTENMICAGLLDIGGKDVCHGDSGGGLFYNDVLIGIVSWGNGCANPFFPAVYTAVASYTDWVSSIVYKFLVTPN